MINTYPGTIEDNRIFTLWEQMNVMANARAKVVVWEMIMNNVLLSILTEISQSLSRITIGDREKGETIVSNHKKELY